MSEKKEIDGLAIIAEEAKKRAEACSVELQELLEKYHCRIDVGVAITGSGKVSPILQILPLVEKNEEAK